MGFRQSGYCVIICSFLNRNSLKHPMCLCHSLVSCASHVEKCLFHQSNWLQSHELRVFWGRPSKQRRGWSSFIFTKKMMHLRHFIAPIAPTGTWRRFLDSRAKAINACSFLGWQQVDKVDHWGRDRIWAVSKRGPNKTALYLCPFSSRLFPVCWPRKVHGNLHF